MTRIESVETAKPTVGRIPEIEGTRALAAMLVVIFHLSGAVNVVHPGLIPSGVNYWIARLGPLGVAVFFILSGFLLYQPFAVAALNGEAAPNLGRYYLRRFTRIFPAYWVALAIFLFVVGPKQVNGLGETFMYFGLVQNYHAGYMFRGLGVAWSLVIEVSFYLVLPAFAFLLRGRKVPQTRNAWLRRQLLGLGAIYGAGFAARVWAASPPDQYFSVYHLWRPHLYLDKWLPGFLDSFALGMLLAVLAVMVHSGATLPRWIQSVVRRALVPWLGAACIYWLLQQANFPTVPTAQFTMFQVITLSTLMPLVAVLLVIPVALAPDKGGVIRSGLGSGPMVAVGAVSYGIFLWHLIAIEQVLHWISEQQLPRSAMVLVLLVLGITAVAASLSYLVIERPSIRWATTIGRRPHRLSKD